MYLYVYMQAYVLCARISMCIAYSIRSICVRTFKNFVFLFAYDCIYKNLLHTCTCFTVFNNYTTTYSTYLCFNNPNEHQVNLTFNLHVKIYFQKVFFASKLLKNLLANNESIFALIH